MLKSNKTKLIIGILISLIFLYLAARKVDFSHMYQALVAANYWYVLIAVFLMVFSHWLRALRWSYFLKPIQTINTLPLFNALIIGYMFNIFLPAHLGEFVRAYVVAKKRTISSSSVFASIVIERIIDVFSLLAIMAITIVVFPFPSWVRTSGYLSFIFIALLFLILILLKRNRAKSSVWLNKLSKPLPLKFRQKIEELLFSFLDGVVPLKHPSHYFIVTVITILMWAIYTFVFQIVFYSFDFVQIYSLPWYAALVLLVITTISILVPSSPGYVGTYHYLCTLALGMFSVPESPALSFAVVMHGLSFIPVLVLGLVILSIEGLNIKNIQSKSKAFSSGDSV